MTDPQGELHCDLEPPEMLAMYDRYARLPVADLGVQDVQVERALEMRNG